MVKVRKDLTGQKFGRLTVLKQTDDYIYPNGSRRACWLCECDCNEHNQIIVLGQSLTGKLTRSCGCLQKEVASQIGKDCGKKVNMYNLNGEYGVLWTTNTNKEVYFDLENASQILEHAWYEDSRGYATSRINGKLVNMHIFLGYKWHDHINRNKMDNRIDNFRPCTHQENIRNGTKRKRAKYKYIGVDQDIRRNKWRVRIVVNKTEKFIGYYDTEQDAVIARLQAEAKYFGEFAPQIYMFEEYGIKCQPKGGENNE